MLVQREMESGRAPLASITPIPRGQFAPPEAWRPGGRAPAAETATGFIRKEIRLAGLIHSRSRSVAGNNWLGKDYRTHALPSSSISSRAGAITPARSCCGKLQPKRRRAFSFRIGRHPAAIRTGTSTTWLHRWAMYSRMCSGPSWSGEREILRQLHADVVRAKRLSHDQPIVFSRP